MPKNITGAWRGFSLQVQSALATPAAVDTLLYFEGEPMEPEPENFYVNTEEITGELLPTAKRLITKKFAGKHKGKAHPHLVALFASMAMGKDTVTQVGATQAYRHKIEIDKTVVELPTRTMVENDGHVQNRFRGVACSAFTLSAERGQFVEFEADLIGSGHEVADATAKPARVDESYLIYGDAKLTRGGTFDGEVITGGDDLSAPLVRFSLGFKNNGRGAYLFGDPSGNVGSLRRGSMYEVDFEATLEIEDSTHRAALLAGNEYVMSIPIIGGVADGIANYTIEAILPRVAYAEAKKGVDEGTLVVAAKFAVMADPVHGGLILNVINQRQPSYLAVAA
ncbi:MAG: hypothetical protein KJZ84_23955 [Bryobacteraceae bacterium]|nr:hypothetical protein [Bryobacteraceae bacterium]